MADPSPDRSWWTTLPGVLTGLAALLTALTGLLAVVVTFVQGRPAPIPDAPTPQPLAVVPAPQPPVVVPAPAVRPAPVSPAPDRVRPSGLLPLVFGERLEVEGTVFEVLSLESTAFPNGGRDIRVTFRVTAGERRVTLDPSTLRILSPGRVARPAEGFSVITIPPGATRQLWARFDLRDTPQDPVLSFTDDWIAPRGEVRRAFNVD